MTDLADLVIQSEAGFAIFRNLGDGRFRRVEWNVARASAGSTPTPHRLGTSGWPPPSSQSMVSAGVVPTTPASPAAVAPLCAGQIKDNISKATSTFLIDHPLDPANKYLSHSLVESPDMMNVYNGNVVLDEDGTAEIELPSYFEALNRDFRYQLTSIGAQAPNLHIAREVSGNRFTIAGGPAGGKVSWQVTGIRQDAYAVAHPIIVERDKPVEKRGTYLHPELYERSE